MSDLVVGEAVVLDLRLAKLASRALALAIDLAVQAVALVAGTFAVVGIASSADDEALAVTLSLVLLVAVLLGYPVAFETLSRGRSLGKMAMGLRVVRDDGGPIRFRHALVRGLLGIVELWATSGALALITSLCSRQGKRIGDFQAGTVVIRERVPPQGSPLVPMPPPLAWWATTLELSRVPDDLALAARQYLARSSQLSPDVRDSMGIRLADDLARVTAPPPPPGTPPWAFLAAVLAERRRRETARLMPPPPPRPYQPPHYVTPTTMPTHAPPTQQLPRSLTENGPSDGGSSPQEGPFAPPG